MRVNQARLRRAEGTSYIPDVAVVPIAVVGATQRARPTRVEEYDVPLPLVIEVWSPSTGEYDVTDKLPEYQQRGDDEIWLVHPQEHWIKAWRRQLSGAYIETRYEAGVVVSASLPGVQIDLAKLFAE